MGKCVSGNVRRHFIYWPVQKMTSFGRGSVQWLMMSSGLSVSLLLSLSSILFLYWFIVSLPPFVLSFFPPFYHFSVNLPSLSFSFLFTLFLPPAFSSPFFLPPSLLSSSFSLIFYLSFSSCVSSCPSPRPSLSPSSSLPLTHTLRGTMSLCPPLQLSLTTT